MVPYRKIIASGDEGKLSKHAHAPKLWKEYCPLTGQAHKTHKLYEHYHHHPF